MLKFNTCKINEKILDQWIAADVNVLLIGEKGVGKSHHILNAFKRNNLKYSYFSGATLDPWIHLLGIPKAKVMDDGREKMEFILPENLDSDVEAIFVDEWNRTNSIVRNALLELQQFKSINGRKFEKLKIIWGAINPCNSSGDDSAENYDVEELDPAQLDRFHVIVELPNEPDKKYFKTKFGDRRGEVLVEWWNEQSAESKKILSPRRLDYLGECFDKGLDIKFLLPVSANPTQLVSRLSIDPETERVLKILESPTENEMKELCSNDKTFRTYRNKLKAERYWPYWKHANKEFVSEEITSNTNFEIFAMFKYTENDPTYVAIINEIIAANPECATAKTIKLLTSQNYKPITDDFESLISARTPNFVYQASDRDAVSRLASVRGLEASAYSDSALSDITSRLKKQAVSVEIMYNTLVDTGVDTRSPLMFMIFSILFARNMSQLTINRYLDLPSILGTACVIAKNTLDSKTLEVFIDHIKKLPKCISANRINDFVTFLSSKKMGTDSGVPIAFIDKINAVRRQVNLKNITNGI